MKLHAMIGSGVALVAAGIFLWMMTASPAHQAATFLHYVDNVVPGKTTESELLSNSAFDARERKCGEATCAYLFSAENKVLKNLHLAPATTVSSMLMVENGLVTEIIVSETIDGKAESLHMILHEIPSNSDCSAKPCIRQLERHLRFGAYQAATITFDSNSYLHKQLADTMNLKCLSRLRGCADLLEMAPLLAHASEFVRNENWIYPKTLRPTIIR